MAASEKLRIQAELEAKRVHKELARIEKQAAKVGKTLSGAFSGSGGGGAAKGTRALGSGLSAATVKANEFSKSLEASNARVVAFGASAGVIMGVERALKSMVSSAIKVEKAMADVNVVMNASARTLEQFGKGMFTVAKNTAQSFDTVAEAATELARQGLGMEQTLSRTSDALILTRLTGMNAADSVKSLTAAVNSFNKEGVTSAEIVNRMAKVDAAFAVSSEDLAKSVSRVGSSAVDAGVSLNQLMAITTAVQQKTARGGAVIGNAFKTIFTRIQRSDVQKTLRDMGVAVTDSNGKMLDAITILQNLSSSFGNLAKAEQAAVGEQVAGVFQINILKAAMSDLVNKNGEYVRALHTANGATNEAYIRNEQLNQTLDALANRTLANLTQAGANIGGATLEPAIRKLLNGVNATIEAFGEGGAAESLGQTLGKGLMAGIGSFISGPGILLAGVAIGKLVANLAKFAKTAFKEFMGLNKAAESRRALQQSITDLLMKEPALIAKVRNSESGLLDLEKQILNTVKLQNSERRRAALIAKSLSRSLSGRGLVTGPKGTVAPPGAAGGFVPNFASAGGERAAAAAGGYRAGAIRTMNQPGAGSMMYNSAETVKRFPGMTQSAIMPPQNSPAGAGYKSAFGAAHGFNPYAGSGFIPNFAPTSNRAKLPETRGRKRAPLETSRALEGKQYQIDASEIGIILGFAGNKVKPFENFDSKTPGTLNGLKTKDSRLATALTKEKASVRLNGVRVKSFVDSPSQDNAEKLFEKILSRELEQGIGDVANNIITQFNIKDKTLGKMGKLSPGLQGEVFEESMRMAMKAASATPGADFDFEAGKAPSDDLQKVFGKPIDRIDAKRRIQSARKGEMPKKYFNDRMTGKEGITQIMAQRQAVLNPKSKKAWGFVPNFSALTSAMGREMSAGVPASAIRVGSSPALRSSGNPNGVGVYNTVHEPGGLNQGIARSRSMGINPKSHGAAGGFIPNFINPDDFDMSNPKSALKASREQAKAAGNNVKSSKGMGAAADKMMMASIGISMLVGGLGDALGGKGQAGLNTVSNIGTSAMMGFSMGGPLGALAGGALGALTSVGDIQTLLGMNDDKIKAEEMAAVAAEVSESVMKLSAAMNQLKDADATSGAKKVTAINTVLDEYNKLTDAAKGSDDILVKKLRNELEANINIREVALGNVGDPKKLEKITEEIVQTSARMTALLNAGKTPVGAFLKGKGGISSVDSGGAMARQIFSAQVQSALINTVANRSAGAPLKEGFLRDPDGVAFNQLTGERVTPFVDEIKQQRDRAQKIFAERERIEDENKIYGAKMDYFGQGGPIALPGEDALVKKSIDRRNEALKAAGLGEEGFSTQISSIAKEMANMLREGGEGVFADAIEKAAESPNPEIKLALENFVGGAFGALDSRGVVGLVNPELIVDPERKDIAKTQRFKAGDVRAAFTNARLRREETGRERAFGAASELGSIKRAGATSAAERANANRMLQFQFAGDDLINQQATIQRQGVLDKNFQAEDELGVKQKAKLDAAEIKLREKALGELKKIKADEFDDRVANIKSLEEFTEKSKNLRGEAIQAELDKYKNIENTQGALTTAEEARVNYLTDRLSKQKEIDGETRRLNDERDKSTKNQTDIIDENAKSLVEMRKKMLEFNAVAEDLKIEDDFTKASNKVKGLQSQSNRGFGISGQEMASARTDARRAQIRQDGASAANPGQAFRDAFTYNDIDAVHEFEEGVVSVAQNMQSSFSSAFQSIASGASSAGDAFAGMAQSILDSISQMSFDMASKMMFSSMGFSKGGLVKGYQSGGLVTGGSGHKDDVLTKMQGGEFVIRKSAVNKLGVGTLNAMNEIPGYASGGKAPGMGKMLAIGAGAAALSGVLSGGGKSAGPKPLPSQDYGFGRSKYGFLGGPDPDARGADRLGGGGGAASVSLNKAFVYYRRDPKTGALISEAARPTEGRFEVSDRLSLLGRLGEDDPQTARMFEKEQRMSKYQDYLAKETQSRKDQVDAVKRKKRGNLIKAYASAAMLIGGAKFMGGGGGGSEAFVVGADEAMGPGFNDFQTGYAGSSRAVATGGGMGGGLARVMGGEYIMSPSAVRTHGVNVMSELNRGNLPGYATGGLVGNQGGAAGTPAGGIGDTTNNVKININVDKSGGTEATAEATEQKSTGQERDDVQETEKNKELGKILQGVVLQEIVKQQRPGGLLQKTGQKTSR